MKVVLFVFISWCICITNANLMAAAGMIASSSPVRNVLISTGIGRILKNGANSMYEASGFRYASDQGTKIRKAIMKNHQIVEVHDPFQRRNGSLPAAKKDTFEERMYSERVFGVLNSMDKNTCISRLMCEIGAEPKSFGAIGLKIHHYLQSVPPVTWNSFTFSYKEAFQVGLKQHKSVCRKYYSTCTYNLSKIIYFMWSFIKPNL